jgi:hypothetical protein
MWRSAALSADGSVAVPPVRHRRAKNRRSVRPGDPLDHERAPELASLATRASALPTRCGRRSNSGWSSCGLVVPPYRGAPTRGGLPTQSCSPNGCVRTESTRVHDGAWSPRRPAGSPTAHETAGAAPPGRPARQSCGGPGSTGAIPQRPARTALLIPNSRSRAWGSSVA